MKLDRSCRDSVADPTSLEHENGDVFETVGANGGAWGLIASIGLVVGSARDAGDQSRVAWKVEDTFLADSEDGSRAVEGEFSVCPGVGDVAKNGVKDVKDDVGNAVSGLTGGNRLEDGALGSDEGKENGDKDSEFCGWEVTLPGVSAAVCCAFLLVISERGAGA